MGAGLRGVLAAARERLRAAIVRQGSALATYARDALMFLGGAVTVTLAVVMNGALGTTLSSRAGSSTNSPRIVERAPAPVTVDRGAVIDQRIGPGPGVILLPAELERILLPTAAPQTVEGNGRVPPSPLFRSQPLDESSQEAVSAVQPNERNAVPFAPGSTVPLGPQPIDELPIAVPEPAEINSESSSNPTASTPAPVVLIGEPSAAAGAAPAGPTAEPLAVRPDVTVAPPEPQANLDSGTSRRKKTDTGPPLVPATEPPVVEPDPEDLPAEPQLNPDHQASTRKAWGIEIALNAPGARRRSAVATAALIAPPPHLERTETTSSEVQPSPKSHDSQAGMRGSEAAIVAKEPAIVPASAPQAKPKNLQAASVPTTPAGGTINRPATASKPASEPGKPTTRSSPNSSSSKSK
jgi:hypothetical protein